MALAGVVLAAGGGARFKEGNKLLLPFRGRPVIYHVVREALRSELEPVLLVIGHEGERVSGALEGLRYDPKLRVVRNPRWRSGRASSVKTAIEQLPKGARGALFLQGDMPLMTHQVIDRVVEGLLKNDARLCFPLHRGEKGHPVAFSRGLLAELCRLQGDRSGFALTRRYWDEALKLPLRPEEEITQFDLDTRADYQRLLQLESEQGWR